MDERTKLKRGDGSDQENKDDIQLMPEGPLRTGILLLKTTATTGRVLRLHWRNGSEAKDQGLRNSGANRGFYIRRVRMDLLSRRLKNRRVAVCYVVCATAYVGLLAGAWSLLLWI